MHSTNTVVFASPAVVDQRDIFGWAVRRCPTLRGAP